MIYLDYAATSYRKPQEVTDAVCRALSGTGNAGRGVNDASLGASRTVFETRCLLDRLFHGYGPAQTAFTCNATEALNTAIYGTLRPGDHVITTALEHNSVLRPLYRMEEEGVQLTVLPADSRGNIDYGGFAAAARENTKAVVCTHASNLTGNVLDLARIGAFCRERGILLIADASQSAGFLPVDMQRMNIDILCVTGHKALMGPQGTGAVLVREGLRVRPLKSGGSGIRTFDRAHPEEMPAALEAGTLNVHGIAGLKAALEYRERIGADVIREKEERLAAAFYTGIKDIPGVRVYSDFDSPVRVPIVTMNIRDIDSGTVGDALRTEYGIQIRTGGHCAPLMHRALGTETQGAVRFSFGWFTSEEEVQTAVRAVRELAEDAGA